MSFRTLAQKDDWGRVVMCDRCSDVHLSIDRVAVTLKKNEVLDLLDLLNDAVRSPDLSAIQEQGLAKMSGLFSRD